MPVDQVASRLFDLKSHAEEIAEQYSAGTKKHRKHKPFS
jgi:hypothetical protein